MKNLENRAKDFSYELPDGTPVVKLGVIATLYFKEGYTAGKKLKIIDCFRKFNDEFGAHLNGLLQDSYKKLTSESLGKL
ncbi:hypothetical protein [Pseudomonas sp. NPDC087614]|uniref:hypothetical protein n=1 Tax=Pseudomonas sp. NPDC087614 TaxID=3364442 RepID=UPI00380D7661